MIHFAVFLQQVIISRIIDVIAGNAAVRVFFVYGVQKFVNFFTRITGRRVKIDPPDLFV